VIKRGKWIIQILSGRSNQPITSIKKLDQGERRPLDKALRRDPPNLNSRQEPHAHSLRDGRGTICPVTIFLEGGHTTCSTQASSLGGEAPQPAASTITPQARLHLSPVSACWFDVISANPHMQCNAMRILLKCKRKQKNTFNLEKHLEQGKLMTNISLWSNIPLLSPMGVPRYLTSLSSKHQYKCHNINRSHQGSWVI
jgi:hypothetical protein